MGPLNSTDKFITSRPFQGSLSLHRFILCLLFAPTEFTHTHRSGKQILVRQKSKICKKEQSPYNSLASKTTDLSAAHTMFYVLLLFQDSLQLQHVLQHNTPLLLWNLTNQRQGFSFSRLSIDFLPYLSCKMFFTRNVPSFCLDFRFPSQHYSLIQSLHYLVALGVCLFLLNYT